MKEDNMKIYLGADHAGFTLKEKVKKYFDKNKIDYVDMSKKKVDSDDYPDVAFKLGERVSAEKVKGSGLKEVNVFVNGIGQGRDSAVRALNANGFHVLSIKDITPLPHNGCRPPKPRRV